MNLAKILTCGGLLDYLMEGNFSESVLRYRAGWLNASCQRLVGAPLRLLRDAMRLAKCQCIDSNNVATLDG
jgi:hypothetical protein